MAGQWLNTLSDGISCCLTRVKLKIVWTSVALLEADDDEGEDADDDEDDGGDDQRRDLLLPDVKHDLVGKAGELKHLP